MATAQLSQEKVAQIFEEHHRLERNQERSLIEKKRSAQEYENDTLALMRHTWHWTLDESNPERMSLRRYATGAGNDLETIRANAKGFILMESNDGQCPSLTPSEARMRARMSPDMEHATEAEASERGLAFTTVHNQYRGDVRQVLDGARKQAEERGTTVKAEAPAVAQDLSLQRRLREEKAKSEERKKHQPSGEERRKQYRYHYNDVNYQLEQARQHLVRAEQLTGGTGNNFDDDHRNFLSHKLNEVRRLVDSLDHTILGGNTPDWGDKVLVMTGSTSN